MITDKVSVEGATVTIRAESESTARAIAAAADRQVVSEEGRAPEKVDRFFDDFGDWLESIVNGLNRPSLGIMSWVLAVVAATMTFMSFGRLMPQLELAFGVVGVVVILLIKTFTARWAKAINLNLPQVAETYKLLAWGGVALVLVVAVAFQAAVSEDVETGTTAVHDAVEREDRAIKDAEFNAEQMIRPTDTAEILARDIDRRLAQTAQNNKGLTDMTIATAIGAGPRDSEGQLPTSFCMPNPAMKTYVDKYCPDLIDMEKGFQRRLAYDQALQRITERKAANDIARTKLPKKSSSLSLVEGVGTGEHANLWGIFFVALGMLFVEVGMVACQFYAKRHPRGVTSALAGLSTSVPAQPATGARP